MGSRDGRQEEKGAGERSLQTQWRRTRTTSSPPVSVQSHLWGNNSLVSTTTRPQTRAHRHTHTERPAKDSALVTRGPGPHQEAFMVAQSQQGTTS